MQGLMASLWLPPAAVLEWLEAHTQIRLSILLTFLFGKSEAFVWVMRWAGNFARVGSEERWRGRGGLMNRTAPAPLDT